MPPAVDRRDVGHRELAVRRRRVLLHREQLVVAELGRGAERSVRAGARPTRPKAAARIASRPRAAGRPAGRDLELAAACSDPDTSACALLCVRDGLRPARARLASFHETAGAARRVAQADLGGVGGGERRVAAVGVVGAGGRPPPAAPSGPLITLHVCDVTDFGGGLRHLAAGDRVQPQALLEPRRHLPRGRRGLLLGLRDGRVLVRLVRRGHRRVHVRAAPRAPARASAARSTAGARRAHGGGRSRPRSRAPARASGAARAALLHRNCCSFCDALCDRLRVRRPPAWVDRVRPTRSRRSARRATT